jgi:Fe-S cluster biogenesis protein NfuA
MTRPIDEIIENIKNIIAERIQPIVANDGGFCEFVSFDNGVVAVYMGGSCSGCASSAVTLKNGIENMLMHFVPEVTSVVNSSDSMPLDEWPFIGYGETNE